MGSGWLDDVAAPTRRWAPAVPFVIGTFCLSVLEAYERAAFDPIGVAYQAALTAALLFVPVVILVNLVRTKLCWALVVTAMSVAPLVGLVRTLQGTGTGIDAFTPYLTTVLVVGIGGALLAAGAEIMLCPDDHPRVRRFVHEAFGSAGGAARPQGFWRAEE